MVNLINIKSLRTLFENRFNPVVSTKIVNSISVFNKSDILAFYISILFYSIIDISTLRIPPFLQFLYSSPKIVHFLISKTLGIQIEYSNVGIICTNHSNLQIDCEDPFECLNLLLQKEAEFPEIGIIDSNFVIYLFKQCNALSQQTVLDAPYTLITIELHLSRDNFSDPFLVFCKTEKFTDVNKAMEVCHSLNYTDIYNTIISSSNSSVLNKLKHYYAMYPELAFQPNIDSFYHDRLLFLSSILDLPLNLQVLELFVPSYCLARLSGNQEKTFSIYFHYFTKIIQSKKSDLFKLIDSWIVSVDGLFLHILNQKLPLGDAFYFVENAQNVKFFFTDILNLVLASRHDYYYDLLNAIILTYPSEKIIKLVKKNQFIMKKEHLDKYREYFVYLSNKKE